MDLIASLLQHKREEMPEDMLLLADPESLSSYVSCNKLMKKLLENSG